MSKIIVVTSGKGGVGKTTSTAALGAALALQGHKVAVVDFDVGLRNLDLVMGAERRVVFDLINVAQGDAKLNQALIRDKRLPNLFLLPASQTRDKDALTEEGVESVIGELRNRFDFVICDSPAGIERGATLAMRFADAAVVVANPEVSSLRDSDRIIGLLDAKTRHAEKGGRMEKHLLLTRYDSGRVARGEMLSVEDVLEILSIPLLGIVPDNQEVLRASNLGSPIVLHNAACAPARAYIDAAHRLCGGDVPISVPSEQRSLFRKLFGRRAACIVETVSATFRSTQPEPSRDCTPGRDPTNSADSCESSEGCDLGLATTDEVSNQNTAYSSHRNMPPNEPGNLTFATPAASAQDAANPLAATALSRERCDPDLATADGVSNKNTTHSAPERILTSGCDFEFPTPAISTGDTANKRTARSNGPAKKSARKHNTGVAKSSQSTANSFYERTLSSEVGNLERAPPAASTQNATDSAAETAPLNACCDSELSTTDDICNQKASNSAHERLPSSGACHFEFPTSAASPGDGDTANKRRARRNNPEKKSPPKNKTRVAKSTQNASVRADSDQVVSYPQAAK